VASGLLVNFEDCLGSPDDALSILERLDKC
jgi:hypothetical protein